MTPFEKALEVVGGVTELARRVNANTNQVSNWRTRGVPVDKCAAVEKATNGVVTRRDLRPHDWEHIWPELRDSGKRRRSTDKGGTQ